MTTTAKGQNGQLSFDGQFVTIARKGFLAASTQGRSEKRIPISSIQAVQFKPAGALTQGFIAFTISGGTEMQSRFGNQTQSAWQDENSVVFLKRSNADMTAFRDAVEAAIGQSASPATHDPADQLARLAELHAAGVLSDEEFAAAKAKALGL